MKVIVRKSNPSGSFLQIAAFPDDSDYLMHSSALQYKCGYNHAERLCEILSEFIKLEPMDYKAVNIDGMIVSKNGPDRIIISNGYSMLTLTCKAAKNLMYEIKRLYKIK